MNGEAVGYRSALAESMALDDDGIAWTAFGPTARRHEVVMGSLGRTPEGDSSDGNEGSTALEFVTGILAYLGFDLGAAQAKAA
jgi:hypothetical protein